MRLTSAVWMILAGLLSVQGARASPSGPINVLVMHWYDRGFSSNDAFDSALQASLRASSPGGVEYYSEYLETKRFPGDEQARLLSDYLRKKYAGRKLDVIVSGVSTTLDFLLKYRHDLFPGVPIVFATERPVPADIMAEAGAAGFTFGNAYAKTLNLALQWHPRTKRLFVVSGTLNHDNAVASIVRDDLRSYENRVAITYLTDLSPEELTVRVRTLPADSLILYVWQQVLNAQGRLLEAQEVLALVAREAKVPIYGRSYAMVGSGIVGGYVWTQEGNAAKLAEITMQIVNGTPPKDIPIGIAPDFPMFDWRQLQRWRIGEDRLPPGSIVQFREHTFWQQYSGRIAGTVAVVLLEAILIGALLVQRKLARRRAAALVEAQRVLQENDERFRFAQRASSTGTFDWNTETGANSWSPEVEALYGLPPGGFLGTQKAWEDLVHPDDRARVLQRTRESLETGAPVEEEWRVIWPDGSVHWIAGRWQVFGGTAGKPRHVVGINIDVSDRKNMEEALRKSEERFRLAIQATNDAIWDIDLKNGNVSWNDTYSALYGRPDAEDSWQFWIDRIHPEDRARTVADFQAALAGGATSWIGEYRFRRADGQWADIYDRAYIARDSSGSAWRVIGAMQDLTGQKKAQAALRVSEERFRRVFEEGPLGLALVGRDYRFEKVNNALCQMLGYDEATLSRMSFVDITHPDDVRTDVELAEKLFKREMPFYRIQKRYVKKGGEIIWINLTASLIHAPDGEPLHGIAMVEDITEIKRTQDEALFRQKWESLGTLAGGIAHDFNNLLGAIRAQAELAEGELDEGASCRGELKAIGEVTVRGSEIVRQLMIYAGHEGSAVGLIDLSTVVEEMLSLLRISVTKHAVINTHLDRDLPAIRASAAQLQQIVMNLISNASDAIGDRDGVIRVITRRATEGDYVQLEISDTGRGMSPETKAKVFDPFFTTKSTGRGLGLAVVQGIIRSLGGAIKITSEPDKGTTVRVLLPCAKTPAHPTGQTVSVEGTPAVPSQHPGILVVEDESELRGAVVKMLRKSGFEVFEAADGNAAIDLFREQGSRIDGILLDMTLPGLGGAEIVAEAAKLKPEIRVILTSAYSHEMIQGSMTPPQVRGFIRKPFSFVDLLKMIRSSLSP